MLQGEHSTVLSTFSKLPFVIKIFVLFGFEWPFYMFYCTLIVFFCCRVAVISLSLFLAIPFVGLWSVIVALPGLETIIFFHAKLN